MTDGIIIKFPEKVYLGAAVTSHETNEITTVKFRNTGNVLK